MNRRHAHALAQPLLEIRRDEVEPACSGRWDIFDTLIDPHVGDRNRLAFVVREARRLCGECPIRRTCWTENRDEPWLLAIVGKKAVKEVANPRGDKLTDEGRAKIRANNSEHVARFNAARLADLTRLADAGTTAGQAARQLGVTPESLREWCRRHKHMDLWRRLQPPKPAAVVAKKRRAA